MELSSFPEIEQIQKRTEPYQKLFTITYKWQKADKKWMDGGFLELDAEQVEAEVKKIKRTSYIYKILSRWMNSGVSSIKSSAYFSSNRR